VQKKVRKKERKKKERKKEESKKATEFNKFIEFRSSCKSRKLQILFSAIF